MTDERKAEVNRLLAEFEWPGECKFKPVYLNPPQDNPDARRCQHGFLNRHRDADYCAELNALARLETKLPPHRMRVDYEGSTVSVVMQALITTESQFLIMVNGDNPDGHDNTLTEAEARAEALALYLLEQRKL